MANNGIGSFQIAECEKSKYSLNTIRKFNMAKQKRKAVIIYANIKSKDLS